MMRPALLSFLLAIGAAPAVAQQTPDARAVAFRDDCGKSLSSIETTRQRVAAAGWTKTEPGANAELKAIIDTVRERARQVMQGASIDVYSRNVGGAGLFMVLAGNVATANGPSNGCYVYDFAAKAFAADPDGAEVIESWLGEPPSDASSRKDVIASKRWVGPAAQPQLAMVRVASVPKGSPLAETNKFSGLAWAATAIAK